MMNPSTKDLPGSGTIKLSEVKAEFGKGNNLLDYLGEGGVTSSAPLKLTDFYGTSSVPPLSGIGAAGYFDGTGSKISLGECYPGGYAGNGAAFNINGWQATGALFGDFADKFESVVIGDIDIYGSSEWLILVYKPGQHSAGPSTSKGLDGGYDAMIITQSGRPTTTVNLFDNQGIFGNWNNSLTGRLAMFSQMTGASPEGAMGASVRKNYVWNHTGYAFGNLDSEGTQNPTTIEFVRKTNPDRIRDAIGGIADKFKEKDGDSE